MKTLLQLEDGLTTIFALLILELAVCRSGTGATASGTGKLAIVNGTDVVLALMLWAEPITRRRESLSTQIYVAAGMTNGNAIHHACIQAFCKR